MTFDLTDGINPVYAITSEELLEIFDRLPDMAKEALARSTHQPVSGDRTTLDAIGKHYGVSRERVRQVQVATQATFEKAVLQALGNYESLMIQNDTEYQVVDIEMLSEVISPDSAGAVIANQFLRLLGFAPLESAPLIWCREPERLLTAMQSLTLDGPVLRSEWDQRLADLGLSEELMMRVGVGPSVVVVGDYVIRADRERADRVTLILNDLGGEATTEQIIDLLPEEVSAHALSSYLSRYPQFARNNARRVWTFANSATLSKYPSALPAILDILESDGPLTRNQLMARVREVHPVTDWRVSQCLTDSKIGRMPDGRIWLVEYGAVRDVGVEPQQPETMTSVNNTIGVRITVDHDFLRGSGLNVQRWLSWKLGLTVVPSEMSFEPLDEIELVVTVRSIHAGSTISSLREVARRESLVAGCQVVILFRTDTRLWNYRHTCEQQDCPRRLSSAHPDS